MTSLSDVRIDNIYDSKLVTEGMHKLRASEDETETYKLHKDDIIINRVNSEDFIGKCCLYEDQFPMCLFESNMMRFSVDSNVVLPKYVVFYLSSPEGRAQIVSKSKPAVNQASVNQGDVKSILLPIPADLKVQASIVDAIEKQIMTLKNLEEVRFRLTDEIQERMAEL